MCISELKKAVFAECLLKSDLTYIIGLYPNATDIFFVWNCSQCKMKHHNECRTQCCEMFTGFLILQALEAYKRTAPAREKRRSEGGGGGGPGKGNIAIGRGSGAEAPSQGGFRFLRRFLRQFVRLGRGLSFCLGLLL